MARTLITGMSGTGKTSTIRQLVTLGHHAVDLDTEEWSHLVPDDSRYADPGADSPLDWRWRADDVRALLMAAQRSLFVAGTSTGQSTFYPLLDHVVVLTVPTDVATARLAKRHTNDYGKDPDELRRELRLRTSVEPLLVAGACLVLDTSVLTIPEVAAAVLDHVTQA